MKSIVFALCISAVMTVAAQPVITNSIVPSVGNSSTFRTFDPAFESPGPGGAGVTWDFSNIAMTGTSILSYNAPSSYPNASQFPGSTLVAEQSSGILLFIKEESQKLSEMGLVANTLTETYIANPRVIMQFPMTYGDNLTDNFEGTAVVASINATRTGSSEIEADGYGTLILPYGTFTDVLRVRLISTYSDVFLSQIVNTGIDTIYNWYKEGQDDFIYTWNRIESSALGSVYYGAYLDTMYVGRNEVSESQTAISVYPNPARDQVRFTSRMPIEEVEIYDQGGRRVFHEGIHINAALFERTANLKHLQSGLYLVVIKSGDNVEREKLVISY